VYVFSSMERMNGINFLRNCDDDDDDDDDDDSIF
jgi:hypothetical protein